jgi:hypothetical protein
METYGGMEVLLHHWGYAVWNRDASLRSYRYKGEPCYAKGLIMWAQKNKHLLAEDKSQDEDSRLNVNKYLCYSL